MHIGFPIYCVQFFWPKTVYHIDMYLIIRPTTELESNSANIPYIRGQQGQFVFLTFI